MKVLPTFYFIQGPWKGWLAIVPRPRGGEWLEDEVQALREGGLDVLVSLLTPTEAVELGLTDEAITAQATDVQFLQFPISDYGVPTSTEDVLAFLEKLDKALTEGKNVGIHCRQGIGRSATIASSLLVLRETEPDEAWNRVAAARGRPVPDTSEQREWVASFAHHLATQTTQRQALVES
jgi:protein-tyrosine phosphatase